jgi:hypothetical protein
MNGKNRYIISATASNVVTFEAHRYYRKNDEQTLQEEFNKIYDAIKNSRIKLERKCLAEEYALSIDFEYTYTDEKGRNVTDGCELYYQPHFTIEEAIEDAMKLKYGR